MVTLLSLEDSPNPAPFSAGSKPPDRWANRTQWEIQFGWPHTDAVGRFKEPLSMERLIRIASLASDITASKSPANMCKLAELI